MGGRLDDVLVRVWPGGVDDVEPLGGGITNENHVVTVAGSRYVVRVPGRDTELLGADRAVEHDAASAAAEAGVGPEVVTYLADIGSLVTRFVEGSPLPPEQLRDSANLDRVADALRCFHRGRAIGGRFDSHALVERYAETARSHGVSLPAAYERARELSSRIEQARGPQPLVPCHNDLLNANLIDDGELIRIVDWEYAGMGDVFFDLANLSVNNELEAADEERLLAAHFGAVEPAQQASLTLMKVMSDFREAMWGVVQQAISTLEFDFAGYAEQHFRRLQATAESSDFVVALAMFEHGEARALRRARPSGLG